MALVPMPPERERELVEKAASSPGAFEEIYRHYVDGIYRYVLRRVGNERDAEDITALVFEKAWRGLREFRWKGSSVAAWLVRIASNSVVDHYRKEGRRDRVDLEEVLPYLGEEEDSYRDLERREERMVVLEALCRLSVRHRMVLEMKFFDGLSSEVMAEILGCSRQNVAVRVHRALKALKKELLKAEERG
jgi:RNA polymerase sigma-70 factor (ECF subfamily)